MLKRYVYYCATPYHLMNALYYVNKVECQEGTQKVLVWHDYADYHIDMSFAREYFDEVIEIPTYANYGGFKKQYAKVLYSGRLHCFSKVGKMYKKQKSNNVLVCFSDQHEGVAKLIKCMKRGERNNRICLIEEGASIYSISALKMLSVKTRIVSWILGIKTEPYLGYNKNIDGVVVKNPENLPEEKCVDRKIIKQNNIFEDDMWDSILDMMLKDEAKKLSMGAMEKGILWLGDPLEDVGGDSKLEISHIKEVAEKLGSDYTIYLKPHPRDRKEKYDGVKSVSNIRLLQFDSGVSVPVELLVKKISPEIVVTAISAAAGNMFDTGVGNKLIYTYKMCGKLNFDENVYKDYIAENENIFSVSNMEELVYTIALEVTKRDVEIEKDRNEDLKYLREL